MDKKRNILIAGATGFIGQALVHFLINKNQYRIKILTRDPERAFEIFGNTVIILTWPGHKELMLLPEGELCEAIINLSGENIGENRWSESVKQRILKSRVNAVSELYQMIQNMNFSPKVWIQASAVGYYGFNFSNQVDETANKGDGFLAGVVDKVEQELLLNDLKSTRKVILRLGVVLSNNGGFLAKMFEAFQAGIAITLGSGKQYLSYIHLNDLVRLIEQAVASEVYSGTINAVASKPIMMAELVQQLRTKTKARCHIKVPSWLLRLVFGVEKANELLLANQYVVSTKLKELGFRCSDQLFD